MNKLDEIRQRLDAATPGSWPEDYVYSAVRHIARNCDHVESQIDPDFGWDRYNDAPLIAHAPVDLRDLLAVAEAAQEVLAQWDIGEIEDSAGVLDALDAIFACLDTAEVTS